MREILFKGKKKNWRELPKEEWWVEGAYITMHHNDGRTHLHHFIIPDGSDLSFGTKVEDILVEVDPETVSQYTGLTDKNVEKIWENDIIRKQFRKSGEPETGVIFYDVENSAFTIQWIAPKPIFSPMFPHKHRIEQIGNIFDNQDLLNT